MIFIKYSKYYLLELINNSLFNIVKSGGAIAHAPLPLQVLHPCYIYDDRKDASTMGQYFTTKLK